MCISNCKGFACESARKFRAYNASKTQIVCKLACVDCDQLASASLPPLLPPLPPTPPSPQRALANSLIAAIFSRARSRSLWFARKCGGRARVYTSNTTVKSCVKSAFVSSIVEMMSRRVRALFTSQDFSLYAYASERLQNSCAHQNASRSCRCVLLMNHAV